MSNLQPPALEKSLAWWPRALGKAATSSIRLGSLGRLAKMKPFMQVECACMSTIIESPSVGWAVYADASCRAARMVGAVAADDACHSRLRSRPTALQR